GGAAWWWRQRRQTTRDAVNALLTRAATLAQQAEANQGNERALARWREALAAVEQAGQASATGLPDPQVRQRVADEWGRMRQAVNGLESDRKLLEALATARTHREDPVTSPDTDGSYARAFVNHGLDVDGASVADGVAWLRARPEAVR